MEIEAKIHQRLTHAFSPRALKITNESALHKGHLGDDGSGESHFRIYIRAPEFANMSRLARHRAIYSALGENIMGRIHALAIDAG